jgi:hypothetical protein
MVEKKQANVDQLLRERLVELGAINGQSGKKPLKQERLPRAKNASPAPQAKNPKA